MKSFTINDKEITARVLQEGDEHLLWPFVSDKEISRDMSWNAHTSIDETVDFVKNTLNSMSSGKVWTWCIFFKGKFCGLFSLISILRTHRALTYNRAEIAYWLGREFRGHGIMTEVGRKVIDFAFRDLLLNKIVVGHHINNVGSERLILRLGFRFTYQEEEVFMKNGEWITCKFYELRKSDYLKMNNEE